MAKMTLRNRKPKTISVKRNKVIDLKGLQKVALKQALKNVGSARNAIACSSTAESIPKTSPKKAVNGAALGSSLHESSLECPVCL